MGNDLCMPSNLSIDDTYHDFIYMKADTTIETAYFQPPSVFYFYLKAAAHNLFRIVENYNYGFHVTIHEVCHINNDQQTSIVIH